MFEKITLNRVLIFLSVLGILSAVYMLIIDRTPAPVSQPLTPPSVAPFKNFIAGAGIVEAASENIQIGSMVAAVVDKMLVKKGEKVLKGAPLFTLNSSQVAADLKAKQAQLEVAITALAQAKASLKEAQDLFDLVNKVQDKRGVSKQERVTLRDNVLIAQKGVENAEASVKAAEATVVEAEAVVAFYTVSAPIDCEVMQINIHPGEYVSAWVEPTTPFMLVGSVTRYHVRVDVDENDAWRFNKDEPAVAYLRGNIQYHTPLKFEYIEPYVIPKASFTGDPTERVDTRVLQVIYSYDPKVMPSYLGQEVDVYIRAAQVSPDVRYGGPLPVSQ
jgi:HlyD family secretion protein